MCQQIIAFACSGSIEAIMLSDSTPISACEKGGQWQQALFSLEEMCQTGVGLVVIMSSAAISAW